jgi:hypothetical protein
MDGRTMIKIKHLTLLEKLTYIVCGLSVETGEAKQGIRSSDHSTICELLIEVEEIYKNQIKEDDNG